MFGLRLDHGKTEKTSFVVQAAIKAGSFGVVDGGKVYRPSFPTAVLASKAHALTRSVTALNPGTPTKLQNLNRKTLKYPQPETFQVTVIPTFTVCLPAPRLVTPI